MKINNNIPSLRSMGAAAKAEAKLSIVSRRLSSGVRIGSAKEDPSGVSVSAKMQMQIDSTKMASQNSLNGISLVQTAEAALNEVHSMLQRMRELAVQGANDTLGSDDKIKVQSEIRQLREEIDSISTRTEFNRGKLLNGHCGVIGKATGAEVESVTESVPIGTYKLEVSAAGTSSTLNTTGISGFPSALLAGDVIINGIKVTVNADDSPQNAYEKVAEAIKMADISFDESLAPSGFGTLTAEFSGVKHNIDITSGNPALLSALGIDPAMVVPGTDAIVSMVVEDGGYSASAKMVVDGNRVTVTDVNGQRMVVDLDPNNIQDVTEIEIKNNALILQTGANKDINVEVSIGKIDAGSLGIDRINCTTQAMCQDAIRALDFAIDFCSDARTRLGSYVNRLELVNSNLDLADINLESTLSKIYDTDMAFEIAEMSRYKIIQQGSTAIMVQANQRPQQILQLLR